MPPKQCTNSIFPSSLLLLLLFPLDHAQLGLGLLTARLNEFAKKKETNATEPAAVFGVVNFNFWQTCGAFLFLFSLCFFVCFHLRFLFASLLLVLAAFGFALLSHVLSLAQLWVQLAGIQFFRCLGMRNECRRDTKAVKGEEGGAGSRGGEGVQPGIIKFAGKRMF